MQRPEKPLVTVVVPVFNTADTLLEKCLLSVIEQDYEHVDLLVVDDGSSEPTARFADSFSSYGARVFHKENGGLSDARNFGVEHSNGEFVYFLDSDDELASAGSISAMIGLAVSEEAEVVVGQYHFVRCPDFDVKPDSGQDWLVRCLRDGRVSFSAADQLYSRSLLERMGSLFVEGLIHEDEEFTPRALAAAKIVVGISDIQTYERNVIENSITTSESPRSVFGRCKGKLIVARMSMEDPLYRGDSVLKGLVDERAYGFVCMALRSCSRDLWGTEYCGEVIALAEGIDLTRSKFTVRSRRAFRNWTCMKIVGAVGPERFMRLLRALDRRKGGRA